MPAAAFDVQRWTSSERLDDVMAMVHVAFREFTPPSGVLGETVADLALRQREGFVLVVQDHGAFIGSLFCMRKDDALYLTRMATLPAWRRRGVGRALMAAAEEEARRAGLAKLLLRVRQNLPANQAYFAKLGFTVTGEGQDPGRPAYTVMERAVLKPVP